MKLYLVSAHLLMVLILIFGNLFTLKAFYSSLVFVISIKYKCEGKRKAQTLN